MGFTILAEKQLGKITKGARRSIHIDLLGNKLLANPEVVTPPTAFTPVPESPPLIAHHFFRRIAQQSVPHQHLLQLLVVSFSIAFLFQK